MDKMVLGIFGSSVDASDAINRLSDLGYDPKDMSIIMRDSRGAGDLAGETAVGDVATGAAAGAVSGAIIGGLAGLLGAFVIPGLGAFLVGGPIAAALGVTGAAASTVSGVATGAVAGGLIGALSGLGLSDEEARVYERSINQGGILVAVPARRGEGAEVSGVLQEFGATQIKSISSTGERTERDIGREGYAGTYYSEVPSRREKKRRQF